MGPRKHLSRDHWVLNKSHNPTERLYITERWDRIVQELCDSRGGRPGLSVLKSLLVSVDVKLY